MQSESCGNSNDTIHTVLAAAPSAKCWRQPQAHSAGGSPKRKGRQLATLVRQELSYVGLHSLQTNKPEQLAADTPLTVLWLSLNRYTGTQRHLSCCATCTRPWGHPHMATWQSSTLRSVAGSSKQMEPRRTANTLQTVRQAQTPAPPPLPPPVCGDRPRPAQ